LKQILQRQQGEEGQAKFPVVAIVTAADRRHFVRFGQRFRVVDDQATVSALAQAGYQARVSALNAS
jgi:DNA polymerase III subunit alpha